MERDFLGLGSGKGFATVKEEASDSVPARGLGMQWSFPNKVSASVIPQFLCFKAAQEDRPNRRTVYDHPISSSGLMSISTADVFESNQKPYSGVVQKNVVLEKQGGSQFVMTGYPLQHFDAVHRPHEDRKFPVSNQQNQAISLAFSSPVLQSHLASAGPSVGSSTLNLQPLGGVPITALGSFLPNTSSTLGTADERKASKPSGSTAQLTIFYAGSVNVFDGISPEKAQAIMLLAGNGPPITTGATIPAPQVQGPFPRPSGGDGFTPTPCSSLPTAISATSQPRGGPCGNDELVAGMSTNQSEPLQVVNPLGSAAPKLITAAVPQARKASLARFLEKRKERMMNTLPYNNSMKSTDCSTPASNIVGFSSPLPAIN